MSCEYPTIGEMHDCTCKACGAIFRSRYDLKNCPECEREKEAQG